MSHGPRAKLLRRVIGEVLIIVAGVLIALALEGWVSNQAAERTEVAYLESLSRDLQLDLAQLDTAIAVVGRRREGTQEALRVLRDDGTVRDSANVLLGLSQASLIWIYQPIAHTFEDLKSTGNLQLVRDADVRRGLAAYYNWIGGDFDDWVKEAQWTRYRPLLYRYVDASEVAVLVYDDERGIEEMLRSGGASLPPVDLDGLRSDKTLHDALEMIVLTLTQQLQIIEGQRDRGEDLSAVLVSALGVASP